MRRWNDNGAYGTYGTHGPHGSHGAHGLRTDFEDVGINRRNVGINVGINDLWPANQFAGLESS